MTNYKLASGHDNEAGFNTITFPLTCPGGVQYPEYIPMPDGTFIAKGAPFAILAGDELEDAQHNAIFTYAGITMTDSVMTGNVTVALPDIDRTAAFNNWNGVLVFRPGVDGEYDGRRWRNCRYMIKALVAT